jgi:excisionase family DNA binding protein
MTPPRPKPRPPHRRYESIPSAAARAGVTTRSIRRWIAAGELTAFRMGPRLIRLDADELDRRMQPIPGATAGGGA